MTVLIKRVKYSFKRKKKKKRISLFQVLLDKIRVLAHMILLTLLRGVLETVTTNYKYCIFAKVSHFGVALVLKWPT